MAASRGCWAHWVCFALVLCFYAALFLFTFHEADEDVWGRMAVGRLVLASEEFPYRDVFAYVPTNPLVVDHEWLSGVVFYEVHRHLGGAGLVWLRAVLGVGAVALTFSAARLAGGAPPAIAALSLATAVLVLQGFNGVVRAQAFSFLFFALFWWALEKGVRSLWLLVPASALWANLHGGVATGLVLIAVYLVGSRSRRRSLVVPGGLAAVATLANPYGFHYWTYLAGALAMPRPHIVEWRSVAWTLPLEDLHLKLAGIAIVLLVVLAHRTVPAPRLTVVLGTLAASWMHVRFAPFLGLAMTVGLPRALTTLFDEGGTAFPKRWAPSLAPLGMTVLVLALGGIGAAVVFRQWDFVPRMTTPEDRYPVSAVRRLESTGASGRLAVYFNWGEYALYHLYPRLLVSIDGRYETVYPDAVVRANWDFTHGAPDGARLLQNHPADFALYPRDSGAARWLEESPDWDKAHSDGASALYIYEKTGSGERSRDAGDGR